MQYACGQHLRKETKDTVDEEMPRIATALRELRSAGNAELNSKTELGPFRKMSTRASRTTWSNDANILRITTCSSKKDLSLSLLKSLSDNGRENEERYVP